MDEYMASTIPELAHALNVHEGRSQERYEKLMDVCATAKSEGHEMGMDNISDRVNINLPGSDGGSGGAGLAAVIAALGNRNEGSDNAALIAALGNRNDGMSAMLPALMAGGGFGGNQMNALWPIILLALLGRGGKGGAFGGDGCCDGGGDAINQLTLNQVLSKLGTLEGQVPNTALETQNAIQAALSSLALGTQQGFAGVKDSVQASLLALSQAAAGINQNVSAQGCQTRERVDSDGDKTRALLVARFGQEDATKIAELNAEVQALKSREHHDRHHSETTLSISNNNNAIANQQQQQQIRDDDRRHHELMNALFVVGNQVVSQRNRSEQDIINLGTMLASGTQTPTTTNVGSK